MTAGSALIPIQPTHFALPAFPINPRPTRLQRSGLARICQSDDVACRGDEADARATAGWKPARGEVMRWRAAERTPALLGTALLSVGLGLGVLAGAGWVMRCKIIPKCN